MPSQGKEKVWHGSLALPKGYIKGAAGAGDAFCAGVLYGVHENWSLEKSLLTGTCAATACMSDPTCTDGLRSLEECLLPKSLELEKTKLKKFFFILELGLILRDQG